MIGQVWPCHRLETIETLNLSSSDFQPVCKSETMTMYTSGRKDTDLALPDNVGFKVGGPGGPSYASLVLQTHYNQASEEEDTSSVEVKVVRGGDDEKMGQIYFLSIGTMPGAEIPPNSKGICSCC